MGWKGLRGGWSPEVVGCRVVGSNGWLGLRGSGGQGVVGVWE